MKKYMKLFLIFLLLSTLKVYGQGEGVMPLTSLQHSPLLIGAGQIGVSIPNDDVIGFYLNPAILGYSSRNNHASISFMPDKTPWTIFYPNNKITFNNYGFNLGYNLETTKLDLPISIGLGFLHSKFDFGKQKIFSFEQPEGKEKEENYDLFNCFSLGIGIDYFLRINLGVSLKSFDSQLGGSISNDELINYSIDGSMLDFGALITFPISELFLNDAKYEFDNSFELKPITNFSIGYAAANVGDEVYYVDESQKDPLYRTARLGYTFELGFDLLLNKTKINFLNYSFSAEAQDALIKPRTEFSTSTVYQSGIGDINIADNLIKLKGDDKVIVHRGHVFKFFDTLIITSGRFAGRGYDSSRSTDGIGFSSRGVFTLINKLTENGTLKYLTNHFIIEYLDSNLELAKNYPINFDVLSIHFVGFEL